jgi:endonuclease/exonuclease/phosphatase family metal-dependent hydrolase
MATSYKRFTRIFFLALNIVVSVVYLLSCLAPYLSPEKWWMISLLGLFFAFLFVTMIVFIFFWLIFRPRYALISLLPLLIGYKSLSVFFAFHIPGKFDYNKPAGSLRVVHWNVARFTEWKRNNNKGSQTRLKMMDLIKEQNADVLCLQEFFTSTDPRYYDNLTYVMKELGYPYFFYSWDDDGDRQWAGQVIFSRLPIVGNGLLRFPRPAIQETLIHADIAWNGDTVRIFTTHLQSVQFRKKDYEKIENIKNTKDSLMENSKSIFGKLKRGVIFRSRQSDMVRETIKKSPYPFLLTGDFNDVPNSYTYFTIKGEDLKDAFLETGLGVGRTYTYIAPTLRIDYLFTSPGFSIRQFNRVVKAYSDHYMLVTDVALPAH